MRFLLLFLLFCGCERSFRTMRIGVDTRWYPLEFGAQQPYVNGYIEDLLLEMSRYSGMRFEIIYANWDDLFDGLNKGRYDAVFSSLPPYESNRFKYDFSESLLSLGPVLVVSQKAQWTDLQQMQGRLVGAIEDSANETLLERSEGIGIRRYGNIPDLLNGIISGEIQGAVMDRIPAVNFVRDLYGMQLKIVGDPMSDLGLRLVSPKGEMGRFNQYFESLRKRKTVKQLQKKWELQ